MDAVKLIEGWVAGHALQKEGDQDQAVLPCQAGIQVGKRFREFRAKVPEHLHACQDHGHVLLLQNADRLVDVFFSDRRIDAAHAVIGPGLEDNDVRFELHHPVDARERSAAGFAADAGVNDLPVIPRCLQLFFELCRIGVLLIHAEPGRKAVAHGNDGSFGPGRGISQRSCADEQQAEGKDAIGLPGHTVFHVLLGEKAER